MYRKLLPALLLVGCFVAKPAAAMDAFVVEDIRLQGLQRVSAGTVFNQLPVNVGDVLDSIASSYPGLVRRFGGHAMAAGLTIIEPDAFAGAETIYWGTADDSGRPVLDFLVGPGGTAILTEAGFGS